MRLLEWLLGLEGRAFMFGVHVTVAALFLLSGSWFGIAFLMMSVLAWHGLCEWRRLETIARVQAADQYIQQVLQQERAALQQALLRRGEQHD